MTSEAKRETTVAGSEWQLIRAQPRFDDAPPSAEDLERIRTFASVPLRAEQVYVRSMLIASTNACESDGCQFTRTALGQISERIVGQSVLSGHNRSSLPLARFFKAEVIHGEAGSGEPDVVRAWFYWLRDTSGAHDLLLNIDGGIYREVSLSWTFRRWRCSICSAENGRCSHQVGRRYGDAVCFRLIDEVADVLEGSLVYKGADKASVVSRALGVDEEPRDVVLVAHEQDPVLQFLERQGLVLERIDLSGGMVGESLERVWLRDRDDSRLEGMGTWMTRGGVILLEVDSPESEEAVHLLQRCEDGLSVVALPMGEVADEPVRSL